MPPSASTTSVSGATSGILSIVPYAAIRSPSASSQEYIHVAPLDPKTAALVHADDLGYVLNE